MTGCLISVVDDDRSTRLAVEGLMRSAGLPSQTFASAEDFLNSGRVSTTTCLILDVRLPQMSGLELQRHLAASGFSAPIIFITSHDDEQAKAAALGHGAAAFLSKPVKTGVLLESIHAAVKT